MSIQLNKKLVTAALALSVLTFATPATAQDYESYDDSGYDAPPPPPDFGGRGPRMRGGNSDSQNYNSEDSESYDESSDDSSSTSSSSSSSSSSSKGRGKGKRGNGKERMEKIINELSEEAQTQCNACNAAISERIKEKQSQRQQQ
ncbi:MAG: hypothetical protein AB7U85_09600 [Alphaproteobacteria bacterium]